MIGVWLQLFNFKVADLGVLDALLKYAPLGTLASAIKIYG
jgi:hypothetical protein